MPEDHKIYSASMKDDVFTMTFTAPKQLLLNPEWENMVWDQTLRMAHEAGFMPVGPIFISYEEVEPPPTQLIEGESLTSRIQRWQAANPLGAVDLVKVTATVQVGLQV